MRILVALAYLLVSALSAAAAAPPPHPHVYLVIVDGLDARLADAAHMPRLFDAVAHEPAHSSVFAGAHAIMPARTNPNHVTLLTGAYADAHGITGNAYWSRTSGAPPGMLEDAALIEVETLFTVAETTAPSLVTLGVVGKPKLASLFAAVPGRQRAPDVLWSPDRLPPERREAASGYSADGETVAAALELAARAEPDLVVMNLCDVDGAGHVHGPESAEYARAVSAADAAIARLLDDLHARARWDRSVVIVTADHGMSAVGPTPERPRPVISLGPVLREAGVGGVTLVGDGGVEHVYAERVAASATTVGDAAETLGRVAALARRPPGATRARRASDRRGPRRPTRDLVSGRDGQRACDPVHRADGVPRPAKAGAADFPERERVAGDDACAPRRARTAQGPLVLPRRLRPPRHGVRTIHRTTQARLPIPTRDTVSGRS